jgi:tetratricopeptide (TPR) repeat protein
MGPSIFISYRRSDASGHAGRLYDSLVTRLPDAHVFMDVDTIAPGVDFRAAVAEAVEASDVLLAVIGPSWLEVTDHSGRRRLELDHDLVRIEIATALERGVRAIPILVGAAEPPTASRLPPSLAALSTRNAVLLRDPYWGRDVTALVDTLRKVSLAEERAGPGQDAQPPRRPVRRMVTVVHVRLETPAGLDPEVEHALVNRARAEFSEIAERYQGVVNEPEGDSIRIVMGAATLHEDDGLRGVRAAQNVVDACEHLEWGERHGVPTRVRAKAGLEAGAALIERSRGEFRLTGTVVRESERLSDAASPGEILLGPELRALLGPTVRAEAVENNDGSRLLEVVAGATPIPRHFGSPLVGRSGDAEALRWAFERAVSENACQLVTVLGSAGIGKTRLVAEEVRGLEERGQVLKGTCLPYGEGITFWAVAEIVKQFAGIGEQDGPETVRDRVIRSLAGAEQGELIAERLAAAVGFADAATSPEETFWAVRKLLEAAAAQRPTAVIFEDIHWAEPLLLDLIDDVAENSHGCPILLVCVARTELLEARPGWSGGKRNSTTISLDALSREDMHGMVASILQSDSVPDEVVETVARTAEGNPLFVEQMLALMIEENLLAEEDGEWFLKQAPDDVATPRSINALLSARVDGLPGSERETTCSASVVGRVFYTGAIEVMAPPQVRGGVKGDLTALAQKQLISPAGSTFAIDDTYEFVHILLRDVAYELLPKNDRSVLHATFADWITRFAGERMAEYEEIVGYHLEAAYRYRIELGTASQADLATGASAGRHLVAAGRRALVREDVAAAAGLLSRAVRLLDRQSQDRIDAMLLLLDALLEEGDLTAAEEVVHDASEVIEGLGDDRLEARLLIAQCFLQSHRGDLEASPALFDSVHDAIRAFSVAEDHQGAAQAHLLLADMRMDAGVFGKAINNLEMAIREARDAAGAREGSRARSWLASALFWGPTPAADAIERCEEIRRDAGGSPAPEAKVKLILAGLYGMQGQFAKARSVFADSASVLEELGLNVSLATGRQISGMIETLAGDPIAAERELRLGLDALREMQQHGFAVGAAVFLTRTLLDQGKQEEAGELLEFAAATASPEDVVAVAHCGLLGARLQAARGEAQTAVRDATIAVQQLEVMDDLRTRADSLTDLSRVQRAAGEEGGAIESIRLACELYRGKGVVPAAERWETVLARTA